MARVIRVPQRVMAKFFSPILARCDTAEQVVFINSPVNLRCFAVGNAHQAMQLPLIAVGINRHAELCIGHLLVDRGYAVSEIVAQQTVPVVGTVQQRLCI